MEIPLKHSPLATGHYLAMESNNMRIPVGASAHHRFMPVKPCRQHHTPLRRHLSVHVSHSRHPLSFQLSSLLYHD
jgi:hypothetical protein